MALFKRILREPLLHFLIAGCLLFFYLSYTDSPAKPQIVISKGKINQLTAQFSRTRQRPPSEIELNALIDNQILEDLAFKQGEQMGMLENDTIIKRRVQQKLEFMLNDSIASIEPNSEELQAYLDTHKANFTIVPIYSFKHVYINPDKHEDLDSYIAALHSKDLDATFASSGDSILLNSEYLDIAEDQIVRLFGRKFVEGLDGLAPNQWLGPVKSGYGSHLVYIENKTPERVATLVEMEAEIKRDFRADAQEKARAAFYEALREKYDLIIEKEIK